MTPSNSEIIHIFENSRLVSDHFTLEAVTAAYVAALAALHAEADQFQARDAKKPPFSASRTTVNACALAKRQFCCPFRDATKCPDYIPKGRSEKA